MKDLGKRAKQAVLWNTGFNVFRDAIQFGIMLILVRIIPVAEYGKLTLLTSILGFISIFSHNSFIAHTIQIRDYRDVCYQSHFTAGIVIQLVAFLLTNVTAFVMRYLGGGAQVSSVLHIVSLVFILELPCGLRRKMLERALDWKKMRILHAVGIFSSSLLSVLLAMKGFGVIALLVPTLLVPIPFIVDLFLIEKWRPTWQWSSAKYRGAWSFGLNRIVSDCFEKGKQLIQTSMMTSAMGYTVVGFAGRANGLGVIFCYKMSFQLLFAIYPIMTKIPIASERFRRVAGLILRIVAWSVIPVAVIFSLLSSPIISVIYGSKWLSVIPLLPPAMAFAAALSIGLAAYRLALSNEQKKCCLLVDGIIFIGTLVCLLTLMDKGIRVLMIGLAVNSVVYMCASFVVLLFGRGTDWSGIKNAMFPPVIGVGVACVLAKTAFGLLKIIPDSFVFAVIFGMIYITVYLCALRLFFAKQLLELVVYLPGKSLILPILKFKTTAN